MQTSHTHGTGCALSAAIAVELGKGNDLRGSVAAAKRFLTAAIRMATPLGQGRGPVNHFGPIRQEIEKYEVIRKLKDAFQVLRRGNIVSLLPEVQANLGYALPTARGLEMWPLFPGDSSARRGS